MPELEAPVLVVGAVPYETAAVEAAAGVHEVAGAPWRYLVGQRVEVLTCGVGMAHAAAALAWALATREVGHVIQVGSCGSYDLGRLPLEAVAVVTADHFADLGTRLADGAWRPGADLGLATAPGGTNAVPCDVPSPLPADLGFPVVAAPGATVHHVCGTPALAAERVAATGALVESMEGAAAALVAARFGTDFTQIRGVANLAGGPRGGWRFRPAARNAARVALRLLGLPDPGPEAADAAPAAPADPTPRGGPR